MSSRPSCLKNAALLTRISIRPNAERPAPRPAGPDPRRRHRTSAPRPCRRSPRSPERSRSRCHGESRPRRCRTLVGETSRFRADVRAGSGHSATFTLRRISAVHSRWPMRKALDELKIQVSRNSVDWGLAVQFCNAPARHIQFSSSCWHILDRRRRVVAPGLVVPAFQRFVHAPTAGYRIKKWFFSVRKACDQPDEARRPPARRAARIGPSPRRDRQSFGSAPADRDRRRSKPPRSWGSRLAG